MPDNPRAGRSRRNKVTTDGPGVAAAAAAEARRQQRATSTSADLAMVAADSLRVPAGALPIGSENL